LTEVLAVFTGSLDCIYFLVTRLQHNNNLLFQNLKQNNTTLNTASLTIKLLIVKLSCFGMSINKFYDQFSDNKSIEKMLVTWNLLIKMVEYRIFLIKIASARLIGYSSY